MSALWCVLSTDDVMCIVSGFQVQSQGDGERGHRASGGGAQRRSPGEPAPATERRQATTARRRASHRAALPQGALL